MPKPAIKFAIDAKNLRRDIGIANANMQELQGKIMRAAERKAISAAAKPIVKEAKKLAPRRPAPIGGALRKSLGVKVATYGGGVKKRVVAIIGARRGFAKEVNGKTHDPAKIAHIVERGSVYAKPHPFLRPAKDAKSDEAVNIFAGHVREIIPREAARIHAKRQRAIARARNR